MEAEIFGRCAHVFVLIRGGGNGSEHGQIAIVANSRMAYLRACWKVRGAQVDDVGPVRRRTQLAEAAPISAPFKGPSRFTTSKPRLLPQTTGPELAEYTFCNLSTTPNIALFAAQRSEL